MGSSSIYSYSFVTQFATELLNNNIKVWGHFKGYDISISIYCNTCYLLPVTPQPKYTQQENPCQKNIS